MKNYLTDVFYIRKRIDSRNYLMGVFAFQAGFEPTTL